MLIPRVARPVKPADHRRLVDLARAAGFTAVVDVSDAFDASDPAALAIHPSDFHPNAEGHALLADRIAGVLWPLPALAPIRGPMLGVTRGDRARSTDPRPPWNNRNSSRADRSSLD